MLPLVAMAAAKGLKAFFGGGNDNPALAGAPQPPPNMYNAPAPNTNVTLSAIHNRGGKPNMFVDEASKPVQIAKPAQNIVSPGTQGAKQTFAEQMKSPASVPQGGQQAPLQAAPSPLPPPTPQQTPPPTALSNGAPTAPQSATPVSSTAEESDTMPPWVMAWYDRQLHKNEASMNPFYGGSYNLAYKLFGGASQW